jgi:hypothetical protein
MSSICFATALISCVEEAVQTTMPFTISISRMTGFTGRSETTRTSKRLSLLTT